MSAECHIHGTDLLGTPESGFYCPSCDRDSLRTENERLREALTFTEGAIRYAREPHHLSHEEECSICHTAAGHLDAALEKARAALNP